MTRRVQDALAIVMLLEVMGVFAAVASGNPANREGLSSGLGTIIWPLIVFEVGLYGGLTFCAIRDYERVGRAARKAWPFLLIAAAALTSGAWSIDPGATLRRGAVIVGTTVIAVYCAAAYSIAAFQRLLVIALLVMLAASGVAFLVHPYLVIDPASGGSFQGLTGAKNYFGEYMALLVLLTITCEWGERWRGTRPLVRAGAVGLMLAAHSVTAILSLAPVVVLLFPGVAFVRRAPRLAIPVLTLLLTAGVFVGRVAAPSGSGLLSAMGKDSTLTGRTEIWSIAQQAISKRPVLGYGFDAFWESPRGGLLFDDELGWAVPHSHNGYLEILLGLGWCGMALVTVAILRTARDALFYAWRQQGLLSMWPLVFLTVLLLHAVTEADLLARHGLPYFVLVVISTQLVLRRTDRSSEAEAEHPAASEVDAVPELITA